jgi:hypothetical protein
MKMKYSKKYYLSLPYEDKIKKLKELVEKDFTSYMIVAGYYMYSSLEKGGLPPAVINKEFELSVKRKHFWEKQNKKKINEPLQFN